MAGRPDGSSYLKNALDTATTWVEFEIKHNPPDDSTRRNISNLKQKAYDNYNLVQKGDRRAKPEALEKAALDYFKQIEELRPGES